MIIEADGSGGLFGTVLYRPKSRAGLPAEQANWSGMISKPAAILTSLAILSPRCHRSSSSKGSSAGGRSWPGELKREEQGEKRLHQDTNQDIISSDIQHFENSNRSREKPFADIVLFPFLKRGPRAD